MIALLTYCSKEEITPVNDQIKSELPQAAVKQNKLKVGELTGSISAKLFAGQNIEVGTVVVSQVNTDTDPLKPEPDALQVTYTLTGGWIMTDAYLWVGTSLSTMPRNSQGNPQIGQFPYVQTFSTNTNTCSFTIPFGTEAFPYSPCTATSLLIAAKASVELHSGSNVEIEGAWGGTIPIVKDKNWGTYFNYDLKDETPPTASDPYPISIQCKGDVPSVNIDVVDDEADNCDTTPQVEFVSEISDENTCPETITRTFKVTDDSGNSINVKQIITVLDLTAPTLDSNTAEISLTTCGVVPDAEFVKPVFTDNCNGLVTINKVGDDAIDLATPGYTLYTRTWTASDACGNTSTSVSQTIKVPICNWTGGNTGNTDWKPKAGSAWAYDFEEAPNKTISIETNSLDKAGNNWGWTNGQISDGDKYEFRLYVCAGKNDLTKGTWVGNLTVTYTDKKVTVKYEVTPLCNLSVVHVYVGEDKLPSNKKRYISAPGQLGFNSGALVGLTTYTHEFTTNGNPVYVAAHAEIVLAQ